MSEIAMRIAMEFSKTDDPSRRISVVLNKDHQMVESLHADIITRMTQQGWEQCGS